MVGPSPWSSAAVNQCCCMWYHWSKEWTHHSIRVTFVLQLNQPLGFSMTIHSIRPGTKREPVQALNLLRSPEMLSYTKYINLLNSWLLQPWPYCFILADIFIENNQGYIVKINLMEHRPRATVTLGFAVSYHMQFHSSEFTLFPDLRNYWWLNVVL